MIIQNQDMDIRESTQNHYNETLVDCPKNEDSNV